MGYGGAVDIFESQDHIFWVHKLCCILESGVHQKICALWGVGMKIQSA